MDYHERESMWDEQWPTTDRADLEEGLLEPNITDEESPFPNVVGTRDTIEAVRDAEPYMPPIDPPVLPGGNEAIHVATGFGTSPEEEFADDRESRGDADILDDTVSLLRDDSETSTLALDVTVNRGVVTIRGDVPSALEAERVTSLVGEYVPGVVDVVDEMTIAATE